MAPETRTSTPSAWARLALGWGAVLVLSLAAPILDGPLGTGALWALLAAIIAAIVICAFGVMTQAEGLAHRLGEPYGTLVLTLSISTIEVVLIMAVMLGPGEHATIARDSVVAVSFIITGLVFGLAALVLGIRHGGARVNRDGASNYQAMILVLVTMAFVLPGLIGADGAYTAGQQWVMIALSLIVYVAFLLRQAGAQSADFQEVTGQGVEEGDVRSEPLRDRVRGHGREILMRTGFLLGTVVPIVLISQHLAVHLDDALGRAQAPTALSGVVVATIVFLPETLTALRAAAAGEGQRVLNLTHGAQVATLGSTIPIVLAIGAVTGQQVVLSEGPTNLVLLALLIVLNGATFSARRIGAIHGLAHLAIFAMYVLALFS